MGSPNRPARWLSLVAASLLALPAGTARAQVRAVPREPGAVERVHWGPLEFHYELEPGSGDRIVLIARVTNTAHRRVELDLPWCLAWLRVRLDGVGVWDRGEEEGCGSMTRFVALDLGQAEEERFALLLRDLEIPLQEGATVRVSAFLPGHRLPWLPPRAAVDVPLTRFTVRAAEQKGPAFARTLGVPGLEWGAPEAAITERFTREGFRAAGSDPNGSLLFNGHGFLGRNAGLIARMHRGRLVKLVALMEPNRPERLTAELGEVRELLERYYGPPASASDGREARVLWRSAGPTGFHHAALRITDDGVIRLDLETPEWVRLHGAEEPGGIPRPRQDDDRPV